MLESESESESNEFLEFEQELESGIIYCLDLELDSESDDYVGVRVGAGVEWVP